MFTDEIEIILKAGDGGNGLVSFFPGERSGPDGGDGGDGGNLYVKSSRQITNLNQFVGKREISVEDGKSGDKNKKTGLKGKDLEIELPVGSLLLDLETKEELELTEENQRFLICKGGRGGRGNFELRSSRNTTPKEAEVGGKGQKRYFKIIVRLIADFGLIGLPNAGKSSLLNELTNARVKVANYPFTTLEPGLGVLPPRHPERSEGPVIIADIPGLIEGAHEGRGLGINFLKHIEKVKLLLHCISCESDDVVRDYKTIMEELEKYNPLLAEKMQIILLTKSDLADSKEIAKKAKLLKKFQEKTVAVSIHDCDSLDYLKELLA